MITKRATGAEGSQKKTTAFAIEDSLKEVLQTIAKEEGEKTGYKVSISDIYRRALKEFVERYRK